METNIRKITMVKWFLRTTYSNVKIIVTKKWSISLNFEELHTFLEQIENIIDTRPFTYLSDENCDERMTPSHLMYGRNMNRGSIVDNNDTIITLAWNAISAKSWDLFSWRTVKILLRTVKIFMMNGRYFYERSRFSSWQLEIFIIIGPDFHCLLLRQNSGTREKYLPIQLLWATADY